MSPSELPSPLDAESLTTGRSREWYHGALDSQLFPGAVDIAIINGLSGIETQVEWPVGIKPVTVIRVEEAENHQPNESAAD